MSIQCWVAKVECLVFTFTTPTTLNLVGTIWVQLGLLPRSCRKWQLECNRTERYKLGTMTYQRSYFKTEQTRFNERHDFGPNADTCAYPFLARKDWVCKIQYNSTLFLLLRTASLHNDHVLSLDRMHGSLWKRQRPSFTCGADAPSWPPANSIWYEKDELDDADLRPTTIVSPCIPQLSLLSSVELSISSSVAPNHLVLH